MSEPVLIPVLRLSDGKAVPVKFPGNIFNLGTASEWNRFLGTLPEFQGRPGELLQAETHRPLPETDINRTGNLMLHFGQDGELQNLEDCPETCTIPSLLQAIQLQAYISNCAPDRSETATRQPACRARGRGIPTWSRSAHEAGHLRCAASMMGLLLKLQDHQAKLNNAASLACSS